MSRVLYDPERDKGAYQSTIDMNDAPLIGYDYNYIVDVCKANATYTKGKKRNPNYTYEMAIRQQIKELISMIVENTWDEYELVKDELAKELESRYERG